MHVTTSDKCIKNITNFGFYRLKIINPNLIISLRLVHNSEMAFFKWPSILPPYEMSNLPFVADISFL